MSPWSHADCSADNRHSRFVRQVGQNHSFEPTGPASTTPAPTWLRRAVPDTQSLESHSIEDIALAAGAAIGALDAVVRRDERWAGAWRQRLALAAASVTARHAGRTEDDAGLRDAVLLTRAGDDPGPAGLLYQAWRGLAAGSAAELLTRANLAVGLEGFGYARDDDELDDLAAGLRQISASAGLIGVLTGAFVIADRHGFGRELGCWFADALLAQRLGWTHAVPLLGAEAALGSGSGHAGRSTTIAAKNVLAALTRAALRASDLSAELGRRADRLIGITPKLRAKAADLVVERLLCEDAIIASETVPGISDRGLRRLFDRLVELGAVRELSGRPTFRIYGL